MPGFQGHQLLLVSSLAFLLVSSSTLLPSLVLFFLQALLLLLPLLPLLLFLMLLVMLVLPQGRW